MKSISTHEIRYQKMLRERKYLRKEVRMYEQLMVSIRAENSFEEILQHLVKAVTKGLGYDRAGIFLADWDRNIGQRAIGIDRNGNLEWTGKEYPLSPVRGTNWVSDLAHGYNKGYYTNNRLKKIKNSPGDDGDMVHVFCNALAPITVSGEKNIGIIAVDNFFTSRRLKKSDLISLSNFATQAGLVIESFRQHEKIKNMTIKDWLTGVYNRRYFDNYLPKEVIRCRRYKRMLGLLYVDLDRFKYINDTYGHPAGDQVLKQVARTMVEQLRDVDVVVRLGGDEFALLLPEVGQIGTRIVGERVLRAIRETPSPVEGMRMKDEKISVSLGAAYLSEEMESWHELVKAADKSLYQAKTAGRNRMGDSLPIAKEAESQKGNALS